MASDIPPRCDYRILQHRLPDAVRPSIRPSVRQLVPEVRACLSAQLGLDMGTALCCSALTRWTLRVRGVGVLRCGTCRRLSWYACALIMLESTTPFGNFRYLMSKSDSKLTGKSSTLYTINAAVWVVSHLSHLIS